MLDINYEITDEKKDLSFIDRATGKAFIVSDRSMFREVDLHGIRGDNSKIINEIGWTPKYNLEQICSKMVSYELRKSN